MTTAQIIELITSAGMDYRNFKCRIAANRVNAMPSNVWEQIAEMARPTVTNAEWTRAWELAGVPIPEIYLEAA